MRIKREWKIAEMEDFIKGKATSFLCIVGVLPKLF